MVSIRFLSLLLLCGVTFLVFRNFVSLAPVLKTTTNYLMSPNLYQYGQPVDILLNKIESDVNSLSYPFYDLPYICSPIESEKVAPQSLSDLIFGDQKVKSGYMLRFGVETTCATLCIKKVSYEGMKMLKGHIEDAYVSQWLIDDNLPAATIFAFEDAMFYASGFPMGIVDGESGETLLYNHLHMVVRYRHVDKTHFSIVGFEIYPRSLYDNNCPGPDAYYPPFNVSVPEDKDGYVNIPYTYSVRWEEAPNIKWEDRFDLFFNPEEISDKLSHKIHWLSLANSFGLMLLVSMVTGVVFLRMFLNKRASEATKVSGALVEDDKHTIKSAVRDWIDNGTTRKPRLLIVLVSMGVQCLFTILGSLSIVCSLDNTNEVRNSIVSIGLIFFMIGTFAASYIGARLLLAGNSKEDRRSAISAPDQVSLPLFCMLCSAALPALAACVIIPSNLICWVYDSITPLPLKAVGYLVLIFFVSCLPLSYAGAYLAARRSNATRVSFKDIGMHQIKAIFTDDTDNTSKIVQFSPSSILSALVAGIVPFGIIHFETEYIYRVLWLEKTTFYFYYGFLFFNILLLCVTVCEIAIIACYIMLVRSSRGQKGAKRNWNWKIYLIGTGTPIYQELYSLYYIFFVLDIRDFVSVLLLVYYSTLVNALCCCAICSMCFLSGRWFMRKIYYPN